jgi:hypothetical protein
MKKEQDNYREEFLKKLNQASSLEDLDLVIKNHYKHLQDGVSEKNEDIRQKIKDFFNGKISIDEIPEKHGLRKNISRIKER